MDIERELQPGDVYHYMTRPGDEGSTLKILLIEGDTVHVEVRDVLFQMSGESRVARVCHLPLHREHLEASLVGDPVGREPIGEAWIEGYNIFNEGSGTHFMNSVSQALDHMQATVTQGKSIDPVLAPEPGTYEAVRVALEREPMTEAMKVYVHANLPPNDPRNPDLDTISCWSGLGGIWRFAGVEPEWGYQEFVARVLGDEMGVDQAIAAVLVQDAKHTLETARDFSPVRPQEPTLEGRMSDFMDPRTDAKFARILDALQALVAAPEIFSREDIQHPIHFARKVLAECGRAAQGHRQ